MWYKSLHGHLLSTPIEKVRRSLRFHYYRRVNKWTFPSNIAHVSGGKMAQGTYEPEVAGILAETLGNGDVFLDVGANVGYFTRMASDRVGSEGAVYAFEADIDNYYALLKNIKDCPNADALHLAVSDENGFVHLHHSTHSACHSMVDTGNLLDGETSRVPTMTLDHFWEVYLHKKPIQLLKVDVEGAEGLVLNGMQRLLNQAGVHHMILEFVPGILQNAGFDGAALYETIAQHYSISVVEKAYGSIVKGLGIDSFSDLQLLSDHLLEQQGAVNVNLFCALKQ